MVVRVEEHGVLEGFLLGKDRTSVSLPKFVDDTIVFLKANCEELQSLKLILWVFGRINMEISSLVGINLSEEYWNLESLILFKHLFKGKS